MTTLLSIKYLYLATASSCSFLAFFRLLFFRRLSLIFFIAFFGGVFNRCLIFVFFLVHIFLVLFLLLLKKGKFFTLRLCGILFCGHVITALCSCSVQGCVRFRICVSSSTAIESSYRGQ